MPKPRECPLCQQPAVNKRPGKDRTELFGCINMQCELYVLLLPQKQWDAMRFLTWVRAEPGTMPLEEQQVLFVAEHTRDVLMGHRETKTPVPGKKFWYSEDTEMSFADDEVVEWMSCPEPSSRS